MRLRSEPPGLVIVDYLQKFAPADKDVRQGVGEVVSGMRMLAKAGWAVLCLSSTARNKDGKHDSKSLSLSSFKESGEIEFNADSAYVLVDNGPLDKKSNTFAMSRYPTSRIGTVQKSTTNCNSICRECRLKLCRKLNQLLLAVMTMTSHHGGTTNAQTSRS